jgi:transposase-like protein
MTTNSEHRVRIPYSHASVPDHINDLHKHAENPQPPPAGNGEKVVPMQRVVFDRRHIDLFNAALENPDHEHRRAAERAMRGFTRAVEKPEKPQGISINSAAREYDVPQSFLWRWSKQRRVIPIVSEGIGSGSPTYVDREKAHEVAEIYHEAKRQKRQPKKLLEERYPDISVSPRNE